MKPSTRTQLTPSVERGATSASPSAFSGSTGSVVEGVRAELVGIAELALNERIEVFVGHRTKVVMSGLGGQAAPGAGVLESAGSSWGAHLRELRGADAENSNRAPERVLLLLLGSQAAAPDTLDGGAVPGGVGHANSVHDFLLRVAASLRLPPPAGEGTARPPITVGSLVVDADAHRAWVEGEETLLTALEFRLLQVLCERPNTVLSRPALLRSVWGRRGQENTRTVDTHVKRLRNKLRGAGRYIETVRGVGYRMFDAAAAAAVPPSAVVPSAPKSRPRH